MFPTAAVLLKHIRVNCANYRKLVEVEGPQGWIGKWLEGAQSCDKCSDPYVSCALHRGSCRGVPQYKRHAPAPSNYQIHLTASVAEAVVRVLPPSFLGRPRRQVRKQASRNEWKDAVRCLRDVQADVIWDQCTKDCDSIESIAAWSMFIATQQLLAGPGDGVKGMASLGNINSRIAMVSAGAWEDIRAVLAGLEKPVEAREVKTADEEAAAKAGRASKAIQAGQLGKAFGCLASKQVPIDCVENKTDHVAAAGIVDEQLDRRKELREVLLKQTEVIRARAWHEVDPMGVRRAVFKLKKNTGDGVDLFDREDFLSMSKDSSLQLSTFQSASFQSKKNGPKCVSVRTSF